MKPTSKYHKSHIGKHETIYLGKFVVFIFATFLVYGYLRTAHEYNPHYQIVSGESYYATYRNGKIFIGDNEYIQTIKNEISSNDIIVIDGRNDDINPYVKIVFPQLITDKEIREEIIEVIQIYEYYRPSKWKRTTSSMRLQWFDHNIKYFISHNLGKTVDVNFSNDKEKKYYNIRILNRVFKL